MLRTSHSFSKLAGGEKNQALQRASIAKLFTTPGQGSPRLVVETGIEHPSWPMHACSSIHPTKKEGRKVSPVFREKKLIPKLVSMLRTNE